MQKNKDIHISAVKLLFYFLKFLLFLFYKRQIMIVDLQLLCTHQRGQARSGGGSPENAANGTTRGPPVPLSCPSSCLWYWRPIPWTSSACRRHSGTLPAASGCPPASAELLPEGGLCLPFPGRQNRKGLRGVAPTCWAARKSGYGSVWTLRPLLLFSALNICMQGPVPGVRIL